MQKVNLLTKDLTTNEKIKQINLNKYLMRKKRKISWFILFYIKVKRTKQCKAPLNLALQTPFQESYPRRFIQGLFIEKKELKI